MKGAHISKKVLIFGANGEIGKAAASTFSKNGFEVGLVGNRITPLKKLKNELQGIELIQLLDVNTGSNQDKVMDEIMQHFKGVELILICPELNLLKGDELKDPFSHRKTLIQMNELMFSCIFEMVQVEACQLIIFPSVACGVDDSEALGCNPYQTFMYDNVFSQQEVLHQYNPLLSITSVNFKKGHPIFKLKKGKGRNLMIHKLMDDLYERMAEKPPVIILEK